MHRIPGMHTEGDLACASSRVEGLIKKGSERLDLRWNLLMALWKGLERKNNLWKGKHERREHDISEQERQLATREAALTGKAEDLDLRKQELEKEIEQRLAKMEKNHQEVLDEKVKDIKHLQLKEAETQKAIEDARKDLLTEQESARALREQIGRAHV